MGSRDVNHSLMPAQTRRHPPTTRSAIVFASSHLFSLKLKPSNKQMTPPTMRKRPTKSKSATNVRKGTRWRGLTLRNKNRMRDEMPPVGRLIQKHQRQVTWSVKTPPTKGPTTLAIPHVAPIKPAYFPRSSSVAEELSLG